ncbi:DUF2256 domain-containing protein [Marinobacter sp. MW3]|uniref:DUF2256 domain-containing protein n=1 Tax=unclassified Marinobacter TaxID=83889 RepID=UPI0039B94E21
MPHKKLNLPEKTCPVCQRPFKWRKNGPKTGTTCATAANVAGVSGAHRHDHSGVVQARPAHPGSCPPGGGGHPGRAGHTLVRHRR